MSSRRTRGVAVCPRLTIAALALVLAAVPAGAGASMRSAQFLLYSPLSGFPPAGDGALSSSFPGPLSGLARKPEPAAGGHRAAPAQRVIARADPPQSAASRVSDGVVSGAEARRAPAPDSLALFLVGLLGAAAIARRRLLP